MEIWILPGTSHTLIDMRTELMDRWVIMAQEHPPGLPLPMCLRHPSPSGVLMLHAIQSSVLNVLATTLPLLQW